MREYYGLFKELKNMYSESIEDSDIYNGAFSQIYSLIVGGNFSGEIEFYVDAALNSGKNILEIACGDGKRVMIPLAKLGFNLDGVEISKDMIDAYSQYSKRLTKSVRSKIKIYESDIFKFSANKNYDLITIPATTICLLSDNEEKTISLFNYFYNILNPNGRLAFDYRLNQGTDKNESKLNHILIKSNGAKIFILFQEFNNYLNGRSIVNFYMEKDTKCGVKRYLASSNKKIISQDFIENNLLSHTKFKSDKILDIDLGTESGKIRMLSLKK